MSTDDDTGVRRRVRQGATFAVAVFKAAAAVVDLAREQAEYIDRITTKPRRQGRTMRDKWNDPDRGVDDFPEPTRFRREGFRVRVFSESEFRDDGELMVERETPGCLTSDELASEFESFLSTNCFRFRPGVYRFDAGVADVGGDTVFAFVRLRCADIEGGEDDS